MTRILSVVALAVIMFVLTGMALPEVLAACASQQPAPAAAPAPLSTGESMWKGLLQGAIWGVMAAFGGWMKNRDTKTGDMQKLEFRYIFQTAIVGVLVGVVAGLLKKSPTDLIDAAATSPIGAAIVFAVEAGLKAVWRNSVPVVKDMLGDLKAGAGNPTPPAPPPV
jgi:hypothetical protein